MGIWSKNTVIFTQSVAFINIAASDLHFVQHFNINELNNVLNIKWWWGWFDCVMLK